MAKTTTDEVLLFENEMCRYDVLLQKRIVTLPVAEVKFVVGYMVSVITTLKRTGGRTNPEVLLDQFKQPICFSSPQEALKEIKTWLKID